MVQIARSFMFILVVTTRSWVRRFGFTSKTASSKSKRHNHDILKYEHAHIHNHIYIYSDDESENNREISSSHYKSKYTTNFPNLWIPPGYSNSNIHKGETSSNLPWSFTFHHLPWREPRDHNIDAKALAWQLASSSVRPECWNFMCQVCTPPFL